MLPNLFLRTFWQMNLRPQIFVAMSFAEVYEQRFREVIAPAISGIRIGGVPLTPYRVDLSQSGDSILTDIMDGIAHCQMFLADVSVAGHDSKTGKAHRNGNVMYEVGLALACRQSSEVLLIRDSDDREEFLFDVSTIPHKVLDFTDSAGAGQELQMALMDRLKERKLVRDARVHRAVSSLTAEEIQVIKMFADRPPSVGWGFRDTGKVNFLAGVAMPRLCDSGLISVVGTWTTGGAAYRWTELGYVVAQLVVKGLPSFDPDEVAAPTPNDQAVQGEGPSPEAAHSDGRDPAPPKEQ